MVELFTFKQFQQLFKIFDLDMKPQEQDNLRRETNQEKLPVELLGKKINGKTDRGKHRPD
ncbi:MAG: hypothetical protein IJU20_01600 [Clostridia bacterium]|nr:hypothetical protein [Clostridia bacterium]